MLDICRTIFALNSLKFTAHSPHNLTNSTAHDRTICFFRQVRCRTIYDFLPHLNVASVTLDYQSYYLPVLITACLLPCLTALPAYLTICLSLTTYQSPYHVSLHACLLAYLSHCLSDTLSCLTTCLFHYQPVSLSACQTTCLSPYLPVQLPAYPLTWLSPCLHVLLALTCMFP